MAYWNRELPDGPLALGLGWFEFIVCLSPLLYISSPPLSVLVPFDFIDSINGWPLQGLGQIRLTRPEWNNNLSRGLIASPMAVDFVSPISLDVTSSSLAADGYSFENLLTKRPFRAEYFVKPPVAIVFKPKIDIDIYAFSLQLEVGQHKSRGIRIDLQSSNSSQPETICKAFTDKASLLIKNNGFYVNRRWAQIGLKLPSLKVEDTCQVINIPCRKTKSLTHISQVVVTILACSSSSIPCLKSISLWACPSKYDAHSFQMVRKLLQPSSTACTSSSSSSPSLSSVPTMRPFYGSSTDQLSGSSYPVHLGTHTSDKESDETQPLANLAIPEEFIDPLTNEIMSRPVSLPCGTNVDSLSLEEYIKKEREWGREPNDPFTRVAFTDKSFPVPNDKLKQQIESFVQKKQQTTS